MNFCWNVVHFMYFSWNVVYFMHFRWSAVFLMHFGSVRMKEGLMPVLLQRIEDDFVLRYIYIK